MIATVSTVKDRLENVRRFVDGNLAGGVDHMVVFLDARAPEVEEWLATRHEVTVVVTDKDWWNGNRPGLLNRRQNVNANLAKAVLSTVGWADWLFHIDADEVAQIDRSALAGVGSEERVVRLLPLEVVSQMHWDGRPDLFKTLLGEPDLQLLFALGVLAEPTNSLYFRSHIIGKVGIRPALDVWLGIHKATDRRGEAVKPVRNDGFRLLHYESFSGEDFVRKWSTMVGSGPSVNFGPYRQRLADGMKALLGKDLPPEVATRYLTEIYQRHMEDRVDVLADLGLLSRIDPLSGSHVPQALPESSRHELSERLESLRAVDKRMFLPDGASPRDAARVLRRATGQ